jgi:transitional endoplasmic reticulum ATPase
VSHGLRPNVETFTYAGARVTVVDAADLLDTARTETVDLLHGARFPAPVRQVRFSVAGGVFEAEITLAGADLLGPAVAGLGGPLGTLLARRLASGDPLVNRVGSVAAEAYRRLGLGGPVAARDEPPAPSVPEDAALGLTATITPEDGHRYRLRAEVPPDTVSPAHVAAVFRLVLASVVELAGAGSLNGRTYLLGRQASGADDVTLDQVGGLGDVVAQFRQIAVSFRHPQAMARWGARRPQGILMYGPPGTGKTMLARALANEIGADFREIRTPEILDKWLGGSERNIKQIFAEAKRYREPTVMLFDEFDSIISYAGAGGDAASQAVNAVAGIFKQEMNGLIEVNPNVIVVATTPCPQRVDDSLVRSGRFDVKLAIPLPDETGRAEIVTKMVRQLIARHEAPGFRMFGDDLDPVGLARASAGMTGADLKEVLRRVQLAKAMHDAHSGGVSSPISQDDLLRAIAGLRSG